MSLEPDNSAPSIITDHAFVPRDLAQKWGLCRTCGLAEAAHRRSSISCREERPEPLPVPEISLSEMQEHVVRPHIPKEAL